MRPLFVSLIVLCVSVCALAGYDYTISNQYIGTLIMEKSETLLMTGGGVNNITAGGFSVLEIKNTTPYAPFSGGVGTLDLGASSKLTLLGGQINTFTIGGFATATLSGGQIN
ncbi:MAG TPA: hypothetical protein PKB02_16095, partial [Anaerohalosphaeraceae bacterium]|nr:hypothetical protein [Anaerohalosphaeraceae bacterium]